MLDLSHRVSASQHLERGSDCKHSSETGYCEGGTKTPEQPERGSGLRWSTAK